MSDFLPFSRPSMGDAELAALREVLQSGWITTGPKNQALEEAFCTLTGNRHAVAVSSAISCSSRSPWARNRNTRKEALMSAI